MPPDYPAYLGRAYRPRRTRSPGLRSHGMEEVRVGPRMERWRFFNQERVDGPFSA